MISVFSIRPFGPSAKSDSGRCPRISLAHLYQPSGISGPFQRKCRGINHKSSDRWYRIVRKEEEEETPDLNDFRGKLAFEMEYTAEEGDEYPEEVDSVQNQYGSTITIDFVSAELGGESVSNNTTLGRVLNVGKEGFHVFSTRLIRSERMSARNNLVKVTYSILDADVSTFMFPYQRRLDRHRVNIFELRRSDSLPTK